MCDSYFYSVLIGGFLFFGFLFMAELSGALTASLTKPIADDPISSLEELYNQDIVWKVASYGTTFANSYETALKNNIMNSAEYIFPKDLYTEEVNTKMYWVALTIKILSDERNSRRKNNTI